MGESDQGRRGCDDEISPIRLPIGLLCDDVSQGDKLRQRLANFLKRHGEFGKNLQIGSKLRRARLQAKPGYCVRVAFADALPVELTG